MNISDTSFGIYMRPDESISLDPDEFCFAISVGMAAATLKTPVRNPESYVVPVEKIEALNEYFKKKQDEQCSNALNAVLSKFTLKNSEDDHNEEVALKDLAINRFALAVLDHFGGPSDKSKSVLWRYLALQDLHETKEIQPWVRQDPHDADVVQVHPAVMEVAASEPLTQKGRFQTRRFFRRVNELAQKKFV